MMERRPYFFIGDTLANAVAGALAALVGVGLAQLGLNHFLTMFLGMLAGMVAATVIVLLIFFPLFGAVEVMAPSMITGMVAGMVGSMIEGGTATAAFAGAGTGLAILFATYALNARVRGEVTSWTR